VCPAPSRARANLGVPFGQLVWHDEFDGTALDARKWVRETGGDAGGTASWSSTPTALTTQRIEGGYLIIEARREKSVNRDYTSADVKTHAWVRGARPDGGTHSDTARQACGPRSGCSATTSPPPVGPGAARSTSWKNGKEPGRVHGTVHGPGYSGAQGVSSTYD